jgi:NADH-quinone oxidoreductase subunit M
MAEWVLFNGSLQGAIVNHWDSFKLILFAIAMLTTALTSAYILWLYKRIFFGIVPETLKNVRDASGYVIITMGILAAFTLIVGLYPDLFYKSIISYVESLYINHINGVVPVKQKTASAVKISQSSQNGIDSLFNNKILKIGLQLHNVLPQNSAFYF